MTCFSTLALAPDELAGTWMHSQQLLSRHYPGRHALRGPGLRTIPKRSLVAVQERIPGAAVPAEPRPSRAQPGS